MLGQVHANVFSIAWMEVQSSAARRHSIRKSVAADGLRVTSATTSGGGARDAPRCLLCRHFRITWQPDAPRSCAAYGFRSAEFPSQVVLRTSGLPCQLFAARSAPGS
jgi:hypothetical protein